LEHSASADLISRWSAAIDLDLRTLGTTSDADEIRETSNAQPLLVALGLVSSLQLFEKLDFQQDLVSFFAGHSVGELTVAALAQAIDGDTALSLVSIRGRSMSEAATGSNTGMSAVLGGEREAVVTRLESLGLTPANENGGGQIVAAGALAALEELAANPPEGARVRPLAVSGAFHTSVMSPAVERLAAASSKISILNPAVPVISNKDGAIITDGAELIARIVGQVAGPVRWDLCMQTLADQGVTGVIEVAPGGTLTGLVKRAQPGIELFALKNPTDLEGAAAFAREHGA
jgi:[acyl-carrier-protein] S-malonyltransferase